MKGLGGLAAVAVMAFLASTMALELRRDLDLFHNLRNNRFRMVGGNRAQLGQFPWAVSIRKFFNTGLLHICGGVIISENYVLSAGHCCGLPDLVNYYAVAGGIDNYRNESSTEQHTAIIRKIVHPDYNPDTVENDICVLEVEYPWKYNENLQPVDLPQPDFRLVENQTVTVAGWGATYESGPAAEFLQFVDLSVVSDERCSRCYEGKNIVTESMLCAGDVDDGGRDACSGDSGGPYTYVDPQSQQPILVGLCSWGYGCARPRYPGVTTEVAYFIDWIAEVTGVTPPLSTNV